jgi:hypothetical protein
VAKTAGRWTERDSVLYATCEIVRDVVRGDVEQRPLMVHTFPLTFTGEKVLASGAYELGVWGAAGDGSYQHSSFIAGGAGLLGISTLAATAVASAAVNQSRRSAAAAAARNGWNFLDHGVVHISTHGVYFQGTGGTRFFGWDSITDGDLAYQTMFRYSATMHDGTIETFLMTSDWAELVFALWAYARHQNHPRLNDGQWIDPTFFARCQQFGYHPPHISPFGLPA